MSIPQIEVIQNVLLQYRASLHNNFEGNDESLVKACEALSDVLIEARIDELSNITKNPGGLFAIDPTYAMPDGNDNIVLEPDTAHLWIRDRKHELQTTLNKNKEEV